LYRTYVGDGVSALVTRTVPAGSCDPAQIAQIAIDYRQAYQQRWNVTTRPYDGIVALLEKLVAAKIALAVLSNKPDEFTQKCIHHFLPQPDPAVALDIARLLGVPPERCLFLGDSAVDMETARRAGMFPVGVSWGFRSTRELQEAGAAAIVDHPLELWEAMAASRNI
jgi:phosphoglycolate phosphatase